LALRPLVLLVWLLIALPGTGLILAALLPPPIDDPYAPLGLVQALVFGQFLAFIGAWTKVVRLAVATRLASTTRRTSPPIRLQPGAGTSSGTAPPLRAGEGAGG
jgi:hypothetical protein